MFDWDAFDVELYVVYSDRWVNLPGVSPPLLLAVISKVANVPSHYDVIYVARWHCVCVTVYMWPCIYCVHVTVYVLHCVYVIMYMWYCVYVTILAMARVKSGKWRYGEHQRHSLMSHRRPPSELSTFRDVQNIKVWFCRLRLSGKSTQNKLWKRHNLREERVTERRGEKGKKNLSFLFILSSLPSSFFSWWCFSMRMSV